MCLFWGVRNGGARTETRLGSKTDTKGWIGAVSTTSWDFVDNLISCKKLNIILIINTLVFSKQIYFFKNKNCISWNLNKNI